MFIYLFLFQSKPLHCPQWLSSDQSTPPLLLVVKAYSWLDTFLYLTWEFVVNTHRGFAVWEVLMRQVHYYFKIPPRALSWSMWNKNSPFNVAVGYFYDSLMLWYFRGLKYEKKCAKGTYPNQNKKSSSECRRQLQGNKDKLICAAAFEWLSSNQAVLERSAQEAFWFDQSATIHCMMNMQLNMVLLSQKGKTEEVLIKIQRIWIQPQKLSSNHNRKQEVSAIITIDWGDIKEWSKKKKKKISRLQKHSFNFLQSILDIYYVFKKSFYFVMWRMNCIPFFKTHLTVLQ